MRRMMTTPMRRMAMPAAIGATLSLWSSQVWRR